MTGRNSWEERGRERKIARYVAAFNATVTGNATKDPSQEQALEVLRQLDASSEAQWKKLAADLNEKHVASPTTRAGIRAHFAAIAKVAPAAAPAVKLCATCSERPAEEGDSQCGPCWNRVCDETSMGPLRGALGDFGP